MRDSARAYFWDFTEPLEGFVACMYRDSKNLVTCGLGQLIDPVATALRMPFRHPDGTLASPQDIAAEWMLVKTAPNLDRDGWRAAARISKLRLHRDDVEALVHLKLDSNEAHLRSRLPAWDSWPADAHLGLSSWAWACGPSAPYPLMFAALIRGDFRAASKQIDLTPRIGTIKLRNAANRQLLLNAAQVVEQGLDPEVLHFPATLKGPDEA